MNASTKSGTIQYRLADESFQGYLALPAGGRGPGVLALHAWWGLNDYFKDFCNRLAAAGFVVLAPDLFNGQSVNTIAAAQARMDAWDFSPASRNLAAALTHLRTHQATADSPLGLVGFSMGAYWALNLAGSDETKPLFGGVVLYYGMGEGDFNNSPAAFLGHFAEHDPYEDFEYIQGFSDYLHSKGLEATFHQYPGTRHWFSEADRPEYDPAAADLAWERTLAFLREKLVAW
jgi:carboxymethylenebutenolidase